DTGENKCKFTVPDNNYKISKYVYGTLEITPKTVVVKALDATSTYGDDYKEAKYPSKAGNYESDDGFIGKDETVKLTVEFELSGHSSEIKDMDRVPVKWVDGEIVGYEDAVKVVNVEFFGGDGQNYNIKTENGALYITRRILTVGMKSVMTFYGEDLYKGEEVEDGRRASAVYPEGEGNVSVVDLHEEYSEPDDEESESDKANSKVKKGLLDGDKIEVMLISYLNKPSNSTSEGDDKQDWETTYIEPKDAGQYYIKPYKICIYPKGGSKADWEITTDKDDGDCEGNYLIQYYYPGTLTINPRPIEVTLKEIVAEEAYYNGEVRTYKAGGEDIKLVGNEALNDRKPPLAYEEKLEVKVIFEEIPEFLPKYAGKYSYALDRENSVIRNKDGSSSDLSNYSITCKDGTLTIERRAITIKLKDLNLIYGETVEYSDNNFYDITSDLKLVEGDYIRDMLIDFGHEYGEKVNVGNYPISIQDLSIWNDGMPELDSWEILDGYDPVTQSYAITCEVGTLTVDQKPVSVTVYPKSLTYGDEIVLTPPAISLSELPYNEIMTFDFAYPQNGNKTPRNVGKYNVKPIPKIDGEEKGANNYAISYFDKDGNSLNNATLENGLVIKKLAISFAVNDQTMTYGDKLEELDLTLTLDTPIPYDDEELTFRAFYQNQKGASLKPKYVDDYGYVITVEKLFINEEVVFDIGREEIDCNYDFSCKNDGILTIEKRKITVTLDSLTVTYGEPVKYEKENDGLYKFNYQITEGSIVDNDSLGVVFDFGWEEEGISRPNAGNYTISKAAYLLTTGLLGTEVAGYLVADSYDIEWVNGTLTVEQRKISVTLNSIPNAYYDGLAHAYVSDGEIVDGILSDETLNVEVVYYAVADGVRIGTVDTIGKAGIYEYELDSVNSSVSGGNEEIGNYDISCAWRTCEISRRPIEVELLDIGNQTYGTDVTYDSGFGNYQKLNSLLPGEEGLIGDDKLEIFIKFRSVEGGVDNIGNGTRLPAGAYETYGVGAFVKGTGKFADSNNYEIKFVDKRFKVNQKKITVTLNNITVDYGEAVEYEVKAGNYKNNLDEELASGETLTVFEVIFHNKPDYAPVGKYAIKLVTVKIVRNDNNQPVTDNYVVEGVDGLLTIKPRQIRVETATHGFVYDGEAHDTRELSDSYTITYNTEKNGIVEGYGDESAYEDENSLPYVTECKDGVKTNVFNIVIMRNGEPVSQNYDIIYVYGEISVVARQLYVTTKSDTKVYDGLPFSVPNTIEDCYSYLENDPSKGKVEGLVKGHVFTFDSEAVTLTDVGSKDNNTIKDIVESETSTKSKKSNYEIVTTTLGKLTVTKRVIYVDWSYEREPSYEIIYNGRVHTSPKGGVYTVSFFNSRTGMWETGEENVLVSGHTFTTKPVEITNVGTV
ncbi:MAG: hypothetical protein K2N74_06415, partial [Clostridiales bacterium]|nr:hypothetical protein [Clostridiales bacterium]